MLIEVDDSSFQDEVVEAQAPVLVDFWGPRCVPCLGLLPVVEGLAEEFKGRVKVVKVNAAQAPQTCRSNRIMGLPAFLGFFCGEEMCRIARDVKADDLRQMLDFLARKEDHESVESAG